MLDNLNTHVLGALYETFPPEEARRIAKRLEFHYTPKHGSWLNMAEIELSVLSNQCLDQRIADQERLAVETGGWQWRREVGWPSVTQLRQRWNGVSPLLMRVSN